MRNILEEATTWNKINLQNKKGKAILIYQQAKNYNKKSIIIHAILIFFSLRLIANGY